MFPLHLLELKNVPILEQLKIEEALLRADKRNWCIVNTGSLSSIVLGISSKVNEHINLDLCQQNPVPIIRRFSGGGTVFIDPDTIFVTWICNSTDTLVPCQPHVIGQWTESLYKDLFKNSDFLLRENDYVLGDKKFGGNAQYICKERWLHHSSLLWNYQKENMDYLSLPPRMPQYRQRRTHTDFLCKLKDHFPSKHLFFHSFKHLINNRMHVYSMNLDMISDIRLRPHRQATSIL